MKDLIKEIRNSINMSQSEFAEKIGVSFATVNRWENGRAVPNRMAQSRIYSICVEHDVPLNEIILKKIDTQVAGIKLDKDRQILYHGSKSGISGKIKPISREHCDFGKGFYMGTDVSQALTLICDYEDSKLYIVSIDMRILEQIEIPTDIEWAMLVAYNRGKMEAINGTDFYNKYKDVTKGKDIVIGCIANDRMFYVIDNFFQGSITDAALVNSLSVLQLGKQYVAVSQKACDAVHIEKEIELSYLERLAISDVSSTNRENGISLSNDICKDYRREGLFFDEILDKAK